MDCGGCVDVVAGGLTGVCLAEHRLLRRGILKDKHTQPLGYRCYFGIEVLGASEADSRLHTCSRSRQAGMEHVASGKGMGRGRGK